MKLEIVFLVGITTSVLYAASITIPEFFDNLDGKTHMIAVDYELISGIHWIYAGGVTWSNDHIDISPSGELPSSNGKPFLVKRRYDDDTQNK